MKVRALTALMLALCLSLAGFSALAAPTRDLQAIELTVDGGMIDLLEITVKAFMGPNWSSVLEKIPTGGPTDNGDLSHADQTLAQRALAYAMACGGEETIGSEEAQALISQIYSDWQGTLADGSDGLLEKTENGFALRRETLEGSYRLGVFPYSVQFDGVNATVKADIFACPAEHDGPAEEIPEDALIWLLNGVFHLRFAPDSLFGYTVNGYELSPFYLDGRTGLWQEIENTEYEFSVSIPSRLEQNGDDPARMVWKAENGAVLTIETEEGSPSFDEALAAFLREHPGQSVIQERLFDDFYAFSEGSFTMITVSGELPWHYTITFSFPAERQAEYEFYCEIIRNSFSAWGISNG